MGRSCLGLTYFGLSSLFSASFFQCVEFQNVRRKGQELIENRPKGRSVCFGPLPSDQTVLETFISKSRKVAMSPAQSLFFFFAEKLEFSYTTNPSFML